MLTSGEYPLSPSLSLSLFLFFKIWHPAALFVSMNYLVMRLLSLSPSQIYVNVRDVRTNNDTYNSQTHGVL